MHLEETKGLKCVSISIPLITSMSNVLPSIISASGPVSVTCSSPTLGWTWLCVTLEYVYLSPVAFRWETNPQVPSSLGGPSEPVGLGKVRAWPRDPTTWLGWWMWALECSQWPTEASDHWSDLEIGINGLSLLPSHKLLWVKSTRYWKWIYHKKS